MRKVLDVLTGAGVILSMMLATVLLVFGVATLAGCEGGSTGFCAPRGMSPVVSWDRGPTGTTVTVGPIVAHGYRSDVNGGATVAVGSLCGGIEAYGNPGPFWGCDR